jgi:ABC-2 type transport system permease protein
VIQLGVGALVSDDVDVITPQGYFAFVEVPIALFCAAIAPDIAGRDIRQHTLPLYFSRALLRRDYALAKIAAFTTAMMILTVLPQVVLVFGNGLATNDLGAYTSDNWADFPRSLASGVLIAAACAAVTLAIAVQTARRAYATVAVVAWFLVSFPVSGILVNEIGGVGRGAILLSPFDFLHGCTVFIFNGNIENGSPLDNAGFPLWTYFVTVLAYTAAGVALVVRRFERIAA